MDNIKTNVLYYGDNFRILREHIPSNSIDLIYLDPPFNSKRDYNVIFKEENSSESEAQIGAFEDSWGWGTGETEKTFHEIISTSPLNIAQTLESFTKFLGHNDVTAYLVMMTPRLIELHRVLKRTGSIYLHCDPTTSHYLKVVMDQIFGSRNYLNELIWCYGERGISKTSYNKKHDVILFYAKERGAHTFNYKDILEKYSESTIKKFKYADEKGRRFRIRGRNVPDAGKWRKKTDIPIEFESQYTYRQYLDASKGSLPRDWFEIPFLNQAANERLGYPTQKPLALLERIIKASSNKGDIVLDPFCGCGTTLVEAQRLGRRWIGIDITHLAVGLMRKRLRDSFPGINIETIGEPEDLSGAKELARNNKYQFEWWAVDLAGARPAQDKRKGADRGIDGVIPFLEDKENIQKVVIQVKGGHINVAQIRDLKGVVEREKAAIGILVTLEEPTKPMKEEASISGYYHTDTWDKDYPKIQILTIAELLAGKKIDMPPHKEPYKNAELVKEDAGNQELLDL